MSWYSPYKADIDAFVSACLWITFLWNLFKDLPGIISGVSSGIGVSTSLANYEEIALDNIDKAFSRSFGKEK